MPDSPSTQRRNVAALAARLIAEEGLNDYGLAKRKAARQLGLGDGAGLPANNEVEEALREHVNLFQDDEHDERLRAMRETAVDLMRVLAPFRTYLTGMALDGTAGAFSEVELDVFADSAKDVEIFLLGRQLDITHREVRHNGPDAPEAILAFDFDEVPVKLRIYDRVAERRSVRHDRARLDAVEALLTENGNAP